MQFLTLKSNTWTVDMHTKSFMGITIHFIKDSKLISANIGITELCESHTAVYIGSQLTETLGTWEINTNKIVTVVTDNAANIVKALEEYIWEIKACPMLCSYAQSFV